MHTVMTGAGEREMIHWTPSFQILRGAGREGERNRIKKAGLSGKRPLQGSALRPAPRSSTALGADRLEAALLAPHFN
jgi:hypothetical protein